MFHVAVADSFAYKLCQCKWSIKGSFKAGLHYGDYRSKLVHFDAQEIFSMFKKALAQSDLRHSVNTTLRLVYIMAIIALS
jgi:hypothetical protein